MLPSAGPSPPVLYKFSPLPCLARFHLALPLRRPSGLVLPSGGLGPGAWGNSISQLGRWGQEEREGFGGCDEEHAGLQACMAWEQTGARAERDDALAAQLSTNRPAYTYVYAW